MLFRVGGLGDLLVALPSISLARRCLPGFSLTLVGRPEYSELLKQAAVIDDIMDFDDARLAPIFAQDSTSDSGCDQIKYGEGSGSDPGRAPRALGKTAGGPSDPGFDEKRKTGKREAALLDGFELAMGWLNRCSDWPADAWWVGQGIEQVFFTSFASGAGMPMSHFFFERTGNFLRTSGMRAWIAGRVPDAGVAGVSPVIRNVSAQALDDSALDMAAPGADRLFDECARLALPGKLRKKALGDLCLRELAKNEKRLVVHPGSGGRAKRWPLPNFIEVIRRAASRGVEGVLVTGEAEADLETSLRGLKLPAGWMRVSRLPAETLAGLVAESTHYLGNDSGPTHLAAACGASVLALFREDNLPAWRPFGQTRVLAAASMAGVPLDDVLVAFDDFLAT
jgi:hypothetical protein